ncbi:LLM class flavin-dependent oxidoreductase [Amnibacterium sp. CER49]|uniref:LLM class flavin-dependent oxidoreductase n=1 Tax=Amnibacterium sp. CER49 TaxID=3039161 RepID=UPI00244A26E8|nr:LLM class flavin-dependent oxidoreductase [Amnibacterium sp. CER49]MDH2445454.1 LLM class flavin-dependent oxidoreductase [Amnibacterium sp. CER49]
MAVHPFRFGVVAGRPVSGTAWLDLARSVEAAGYDALLLPDTLFTPSPFPALAAAAAVTTRLHVATWVLAAPLRPPAAVVRETAALQLLSGNRFELGIGTGRPGAKAEAERLGMPWGGWTDRLRQVLETVEAVRGEVQPAPRVIIAGAGPRMLGPAGTADTVALALPPAATVDDVLRAAERTRESGGDPELALQLSGVGGRLVAYLERSGTTAADLAGAAAVLSGDADAMAGSLLALRERTGVSFLPVAAEQLEAFQPVLERLRAV